MAGLRRWWNARRHRDGEWGELFAPAHGDEVVSLDLETTGLDPRSDHILSIAAVPVHAGRVWLSRRFERSVRAERDFDIDSIRHHRITPAESAGGESVTRAVEELLRWLGNRPLLGYNLDFDLRMLQPHVRRIAGFALPNRGIELAGAYQDVLLQRDPHAQPDLRFEAICQALGVPLSGRHTALGDATAVAVCWLALARSRAHKRKTPP